MQLLLCFLFSQVDFTIKAPIILETKPFRFDRILATDAAFLICSESERAVFIFGLNGSAKGKLGGGQPEEPQFPYRISWFRDTNEFYVYDAASKAVSVWDETGKYVREIATDFDVFFQIGRLLPADDGFITPISLTEDRFLLGRFDAGLQLKSYAYEVLYEELAGMSPELYKTFALHIPVDGQSLYLVAQSLAAKVHIFDGNLNFLRSFILNSGGWKPANLRRLERISRNPKELNKYRERFSEVIGMEKLAGRRYVVGIRNLSQPDLYAYQCYDAGLDLPVGGQFESPYRLVGSFQNKLYMVDPRTESRLAIIPCEVE